MTEEKFELEKELDALDLFDKSIGKVARRLFRRRNDRVGKELYWGKVLVASMILDEHRSDKAIELVERWLPDKQ